MTRIRNGQVVTEADLERMAAEAEDGYDLTNWKPVVGRPSLSANRPHEVSPRITARIPKEVRARVVSRATSEGRSVSAVTRRLLENYAEGAPYPQKAHRA